MEIQTLFESRFFALAIIPLLIFCARIVDVSLGTMRIISVSRGNKILASALGFFEVLIWLIGVTQIMQNLTNPIYYIAYAGGFAAGNFMGIYLEGKIPVGKLAVRAFPLKCASKLSDLLSAEGYGVTSFNAKGNMGDTGLVYTIIRRKDLPRVLSIIKDYDPKTFYSIDNVQYASNGIFPSGRRSNVGRFPGIPLFGKKGGILAGSGKMTG